jgi:hypothetical protein
MRAVLRREDRLPGGHGRRPKYKIVDKRLPKKDWAAVPKDDTVSILRFNTSSKSLCRGQSKREEGEDEVSSCLSIVTLLCD